MRVASLISKIQWPTVAAIAGAGARFPAYIFPAKYVVESGIKRFTLISAGSVTIPLYIAYNGNAKEVERVSKNVEKIFQGWIEKKEKLADFNTNWIKEKRIPFGLLKGDAFHAELNKAFLRSPKGREVAKREGKPRPLRFSDFQEDLRIIAEDQSTGRRIIFCDPQKVLRPDLAPKDTYYWPEDIEIATAIRASMSIPLVFEPVRLKDSQTHQEMMLVDGGVGGNIALREAEKMLEEEQWLKIHKPEDLKDYGELVALKEPGAILAITPGYAGLPQVEIKNPLQSILKNFDIASYRLFKATIRALKPYTVLRMYNMGIMGFPIWNIEASQVMGEIGRYKIDKFFKPFLDDGKINMHKFFGKWNKDIVEYFGKSSQWKYKVMGPNSIRVTNLEEYEGEVPEVAPYPKEWIASIVKRTLWAGKWVLVKSLVKKFPELLKSIF